MEVRGQQPFTFGRGIRYPLDKRPCGLQSFYGRDGGEENRMPEIRGLVTVYWLTGQFKCNDDDDDDYYYSIVYYLRVGTTVTRPIIEPAEEHKENTKIQATYDNTYTRGNKNHT
jgi:hypothetical protein